MKKLSLLVASLAMSSAVLAGSPDVRVNYGQPGPSAGTGFGALKPLHKVSRLDETHLAVLEQIPAIVDAMVYENDNERRRLEIDVAAGSQNGPVYHIAGVEHSDFRVRVSLYQGSALIDRVTYENASEGNMLEAGVVDAIKHFVSEPRVASLLGYTAGQQLATTE